MEEDVDLLLKNGNVSFTQLVFGNRKAIPPWVPQVDGEQLRRFRIDL
jgi:hypothetical protein